MEEFKLHSKGDNWFHFRKYMDSVIESFSVTYCHDGTVCMTGDYGCLSWQRQFFPKKLDYGFPSEETHINYFAEKIVRKHAGESQNIKTWEKDLACDEIKEAMEAYRYEGSTQEVNTLEDVYGRLSYFEDGVYEYIQMLEAFNGADCNIEPEEYSEYGSGYSDMFKRRFEMLQSVSNIILEHRGAGGTQSPSEREG